MTESMTPTIFDAQDVDGNYQFSLLLSGGPFPPRARVNASLVEIHDEQVVLVFRFTLETGDQFEMTVDKHLLKDGEWLSPQTKMESTEIGQVEVVEREPVEVSGVKDVFRYVLNKLPAVA